MHSVGEVSMYDTPPYSKTKVSILPPFFTNDNILHQTFGVKNQSNKQRAKTATRNVS